MSEFPAIDQEILGQDASKRLVRVLGEVNTSIKEVYRVAQDRPAMVAPVVTPIIAPPPSRQIVVMGEGHGSNTVRNTLTIGAAGVLGVLLLGSCQRVIPTISPNRTISEDIAQTYADACRVVGGNIGVTCPGVETPVTDSSVPTDGTVTTEPQGNGRSMLTDAPFVTCYPITPDPGTQNARELCMDGMAQTAVAQPDGSTSATLQLGMYGRTSVSVMTEEGFTYPERQSLLPISEWFSANPDLCTEVAGHLKLAQTNNDGTQTVIAGANTAVAGAPKITGIFDSITGKPTQLVCDFVNIQSAEQTPGA